MKRYTVLILTVFVLLVLSGCTAESHDVSACVTGEAANFWDGLWHGIIAPVAFVFSLFSDWLTVYEINNNGAWYNFGFLLGIGAFTSGGAAGARRAKR